MALTVTAAGGLCLLGAVLLIGNIVGSYDDQFVLSFTACREMMPDPAHYADCLQSAFDELVSVS